MPIEDIISNVEAGIKNLTEEAAEDIRSETSRILRRAKPPKCILLGSEIRALKALRIADDIIILPADKGSATVIMNNDDYKKKMRELLNPEKYKI